MTENEAIDAIAAGVTRQIPAMVWANAQAAAKGLLKKAVYKIGRTYGVDWNKEAKTITLTSGKSTYELGAEILTDMADVRGISHLWRTDTRYEPIPIVTLSEFNAYARGSSGTGKPEMATLHSRTKTLEIWRTPDSAYTVWCYVLRKVVNFTDVPEEYQDVVIDYAIASVDPRNAMMLAQQGLKEIQNDTLTVWDGPSIPLDRHLGKSGDVAQSDSYNLRGD